MRMIGGEMETKAGGIYRYITDSGRSSLRLILRSGFKNKRFLLPDFLCKAILQIFDEAVVRYSFYRVGRDLKIDPASFKGKRFDALYLINYFGQRHDIRSFSLDRVFVIEDNAFLPIFERPKYARRWIGFNSFRKISPIADGSLIQSTMKLKGDLIEKKEAPFCKLKYKAKEIKSEYLSGKKHCESEYLDIFKKAEKLLDRQREIYTISRRSLFMLFELYKGLESECLKRKRNYTFLGMHLKGWGIRIRPEHYSFYVMAVEGRDELREYLFSKDVFLPAHWPKFNGADNPLYGTIISIPVDSRYENKDMLRIAHLIKKFYRKRQSI